MAIAEPIIHLQIIDPHAAFDDVSLKMEIVATLLDDVSNKALDISGLADEGSEVLQLANAIVSSVIGIEIIHNLAREVLYKAQGKVRQVAL